MWTKKTNLNFLRDTTVHLLNRSIDFFFHLIDPINKISTSICLFSRSTQTLKFELNSTNEEKTSNFTLVHCANDSLILWKVSQHLYRIHWTSIESLLMTENDDFIDVSFNRSNYFSSLSTSIRKSFEIIYLLIDFLCISFTTLVIIEPK